MFLLVNLMQPRRFVSLFSESRDRGSLTSLSSDFSLITEDSVAAAASSGTAEVSDPFSGGPQAPMPW